MKYDTKWDIFHDEAMNSEFAAQGYQILTIDNFDVLNELLAVYNETSLNYNAGFTATLLVPDHSHRKLIHEKVASILAPTIKRYFKSYRQMCCGYAVKKGNDVNSYMPLHQDISMAKPEGRAGLSFWFPLVATDKENGNLQLVPKSHLFYRHERAAGTSFPLLEQEEKLREHYLKPIPTKLGQAIVFDQTLFHASPPNMSEKDRVVATNVLLPEEKPTFYYHRKVETTPVELEAYKVEDDFYFSHQLGTRPKDLEAIENFKEHAPKKDTSLFPKLMI
ncbi:phytanoyl-CoA dioxygenase family protein [Kordia sp. YSTF-M3]|uniref:Phytanoyl-CoA dioxygenase family protein n=1 Tax=Kordia aestuariivivens TaxID=2759037 RepID=A0ABR7QFG5_9FLAO|nr:phytanoyl-CoA dioxygenase family protein [Kordia aestuariivivens]MBC8757039.1 phytanoyl-CoA dioxygenase family protein [Kordia aestuariivivens]